MLYSFYNMYVVLAGFIESTQQQKRTMHSHNTLTLVHKPYSTLYRLFFLDIENGKHFVEFMGKNVGLDVSRKVYTKNHGNTPIGIYSEVFVIHRTSPTSQMQK